MFLDTGKSFSGLNT